MQVGDEALPDKTYQVYAYDSADHFDKDEALKGQVVRITDRDQRPIVGSWWDPFNLFHNDDDE